MKHTHLKIKNKKKQQKLTLDLHWRKDDILMEKLQKKRQTERRRLELNLDNQRYV